MTVYRARSGRPDPAMRFWSTPSRPSLQSAEGPMDQGAVLGAVREDIRETLRMAWLDPAIETPAAWPVFFTAAWSAIRPNVGKSFTSLAATLRAEAVESLRRSFQVRDLRNDLRSELSDEELRRVEDSARAAHLVAAKVQIVVHALHRAARRERIPGTGREESPLRRGIPEWQRWMSFQPVPDAARTELDGVAGRLGVPTPPTPLRLLARWPVAMSRIWIELEPLCGTDQWNAGMARLRRVVLGGIGGLPHPVDLQWSALATRGFTEDDRANLCEVLGGHDRAMPMQTLIGAFAWSALGAPELGEA